MKGLMRDNDFKDTAPLLFGDNFGALAKERLEGGWLPTRLDKYSIPDPHATSNPDHNRECILNSSRGCKAPIQRGSCRDSTISRQLCVAGISGGEEGWGSEASDPQGSLLLPHGPGRGISANGSQGLQTSQHVLSIQSSLA